MTNTAALVLLSGGQDSTTCLAWALANFDMVEAVAFDYGQRHAVELDSAELVANEAGVFLRTVPVSGLGGSSLTDHSAAVTVDGGMGGLPSTFTPGRNAVFLSIAAGIAAQGGITNLVTGICQTDYSGYPDCRRSTIDAMERALSLGVGQAGTAEPWAIRVWTPLMWIDKAATVRMARRLPGCWEALALTHTCYYGQQPPCGDCPACEIRARGFAQANEADPLLGQ